MAMAMARRSVHKREEAVLAKSANQVAFNLYGYQILPLSQTLQLSLDDTRIKSIDDLLKLKNVFLADAIRKTTTLEYAHTDIRHQIEIDADDLLVLRIAARRSLTISKEDFTTGKIANWPNMLIAINNKPDVQKIAIQVNRKVFASTNTVKEILEDNFSAQLKRVGLRTYIEPRFDPKQFWDIINQHKTKILQADFELVSPNMANISGKLNFDLGELAKTTNTNITHLQLNSEKEGSLTLSEEGPFIKSIVDYISQGAGDISVKVRGLRAKIRTAKGITHLSIDEFQLQRATTESLKQQFTDILK